MLSSLNTEFRVADSVRDIIGDCFMMARVNAASCGINAKLVFKSKRLSMLLYGVRGNVRGIGGGMCDSCLDAGFRLLTFSNENKCLIKCPIVVESVFGC